MAGAVAGLSAAVGGSAAGGAVAGTTSGGGATGGTVVPQGGVPGDCGRDTQQVITAEIAEHVAQADSCFSGWITRRRGQWEADEQPYVNSGTMLYGPCRDVSQPSGREQGVEAALADRPADCFPSMARVRVDGESTSDLQRLADVVAEACGDQPGARLGGYRIVLGEDGRVLEVLPANTQPGNVQTAQCVAAALEGLTFPCLASLEVCPEFVIIE